MASGAGTAGRAVPEWLGGRCRDGWAGGAGTAGQAQQRRCFNRAALRHGCIRVHTCTANNSNDIMTVLVCTIACPPSLPPSLSPSLPPSLSPSLPPSLCWAALDVSADLSELGRTPVAVLCAGVKSILDIGRTLEVLVRLEGHCCRHASCLFLACTLFFVPCEGDTRGDRGDVWIDQRISCLFHPNQWVQGTQLIAIYNACVSAGAVKWQDKDRFDSCRTCNQQRQSIIVFIASQIPYNEIHFLITSICTVIAA